MEKDSQTYFNGLNNVLKAYKRAIPCLLIDLDHLDANIERLQSKLKKGTAFRVVVKSLPSIDLIQYVMKKANTKKLMVFHQPFLSDLAEFCDGEVDILLGKPMPIKTAKYFYENWGEANDTFDPFGQIQWLVDTEKRLEEYLELAKELGKPLRINLEIDVGLHRGGFASLDELRKGLKWLQTHQDHLQFSGLMGYDPHVVKLPSILRSQQKSLHLANDFYHQSKNLIRTEFPALWREDLTFNGAGSPTLELHQEDTSPLNDVSVGSALLKPTTFDIPSLEAFEAACFIATPVLKKFQGTTLPGIEKFKSFFNFLSSNNRQSFFIYGGYWKADYCYPEGIKQNAIFGASTNQTMLNAPPAAELEVDDFVFLRPEQSEFVLLQFGNLLTVRAGEILEEWRLLKNY